jgi:hypothetical protein
VAARVGPSLRIIPHQWRRFGDKLLIDTKLIVEICPCCPVSPTFSFLGIEVQILVLPNQKQFLQLWILLLVFLI